MDADRNSPHDGLNQQHEKHQSQDHQHQQRLQRHQRQHQREQLPLRERRSTNDTMKEKRKSEVMIAAQSLDNEVQSVKNLKRISIGSMDMLLDPELEYRVSSNAGKQENRKSWTSGVPARPAEEVENMQNRATVRYTYPSRAVEGEPDESFESELSEISFDVTNSEYLEGLDPNDDSSIQKSENDTTDLRGSQKSQVSSSGRSISGVGTLKRGASNIPLRKTSTSSDASSGSNGSLTKNLLWVPANQHPNVKPENYLELVQDTLHNIRLEGNEDEQTGNDMNTTTAKVEHGTNKENEDKGYLPRKNNSLVRKPSRLRKSYTEFDEENDDYLDTSGFSKKRSSEDVEDASNLTISSTNSSRAVSLRDITDELTKISNNAGLTDSDAITLARTLSMAGSFTSDEPDDIIENSRGTQGDDLQYYNEADAMEKKEDDAEFASNMFMKNGFVIPARSSLRRSKFNTYRVRSASDENLDENKSINSGLSDHHGHTHSVLPSQTDYVPTPSSREERSVDSKSSQDRRLENMKETPADEDSAASGAYVKQQDYLGTPGDQHSHGSKSPSQFIGEDGSNLTSPSTISDFQDIYDHYRQSSVDWEKELKKERDFAQQMDSYNKPTTTEVHIEPPVPEESPDLADASAENLVVSKDDSLSSSEVSTDSVLIKPEHGQSFESTVPQHYHTQQDTAEQQAGSSFVTEQNKSEPIAFKSHESNTSNSSNSNRQAQKRGGWALFSMGTKDILGGDQRSDKDEDNNQMEEFQSEEYVPKENADFIKTSTHMRTDYERVAADRSNHSKNRHSPIFTENNKKEIMEESRPELQIEPKIEDVPTETDEQMETNSEYSNSDSSNSFSAQKLEKKFVNLFKRKGKNKSSSSKTGKTHKKLELTKKATNNTLPKFRKAAKGQSKQTELSENEQLYDASSDGASPDISLGEPVDDAVMDTSAGSFQDASEMRQEEHLSLQPAVSVQSTKSSPGIVVESTKQLESNESREVSADNVVATQMETKSVQMKKQASLEKEQQRQQQQKQQQKQQQQYHHHQQQKQQQKQPQKQQVSNGQQVHPTPPVQNQPQPLPARKLTFSDVKRLDRPNAPMQFTDSAFGFPLPMLTVSTVVMFDHRLPINVERAIYRLSHLKLSDPKRELRQQVMLSNFMYAYLNLVNHTLYMEQVAQEGGQEIPTASKTTNAASTAHTGSGSYTTDQNDANGAICIPDIQG